jgi:hypothetical protein
MLLWSMLRRSRLKVTGDADGYLAADDVFYTVVSDPTKIRLIYLYCAVELQQLLLTHAPVVVLRSEGYIDY